MRRRFRDRAHAGVELAELLSAYTGVDGVVLGLPRGGVAVAAPIAVALDLPLDVFLVRKLGVPGHEELAMGAIASGGAGVSGTRRRSAALDSPGWIVSRRGWPGSGRSSSGASVRTATTARPWTSAIAAMIVVDDGLATGRRWGPPSPR